MSKMDRFSVTLFSSIASTANRTIEKSFIRKKKRFGWWFFFHPLLQLAEETIFIYVGCSIEDWWDSDRIVYSFRFFFLSQRSNNNNKKLFRFPSSGNSATLSLILRQFYFIPFFLFPNVYCYAKRLFLPVCVCVWMCLYANIVNETWAIGNLPLESIWILMFPKTKPISIVFFFFSLSVHFAPHPWFHHTHQCRWFIGKVVL